MSQAGRSLGATAERQCGSCSRSSCAVRSRAKRSAHAIASNPIQHRLDALCNRISTAHGGGIELINDSVAVRLGKRRNDCALALVGVLIGAGTVSQEAIALLQNALERGGILFREGAVELALLAGLSAPTGPFRENYAHLAEESPWGRLSGAQIRAGRALHDRVALGTRPPARAITIREGITDDGRAAVIHGEARDAWQSNSCSRL